MHKKTIFITCSFLFLSAFCFADDKGNKDRKEKKNTAATAYMEASVIEGAPGCGYLLQLLNGHYIRPDHLPKKFRENHLKVWVKYDHASALTDTICHAEKTVSLTEIKRYRLSPNLKAKY
ncbi:MAG: hypothetical protein ACJ76F_13160 [Bacteroidia bacterium]